MKTKIAICLLALIVGLGFKECEKLPPGAYENKMSAAVKAAGKTRGVVIFRDTEQATPKGVKVFSKSGIAINLLPLIDAGITETMANARASGYEHHQGSYEYGYYHVLIFENCGRAPVSQTMSFLVRGDNYNTTEWDQHFTIGFNPPFHEPIQGYPDLPPRIRYSLDDSLGVVFAAEMLWNFDSARGEMLMCADAGVIQNAAKFGAEHLKIAREDPDYFMATMTHGPPHPLLPKPTGFAPDKASVQENTRLASDLIKVGQLTRTKDGIDGKQIAFPFEKSVVKKK